VWPITALYSDARMVMIFEFRSEDDENAPQGMKQGMRGDFRENRRCLRVHVLQSRSSNESGPTRDQVAIANTTAS
jgi:hypothetical protein